MQRKSGIIVHQEKCRGCRRCEIACSWNVGGITNPRLAGINIWKTEESGKDVPVFSQICLDQFCGKEHPKHKGSGIPLCVSTCLFGALTVEEDAVNE